MEKNLIEAVKATQKGKKEAFAPLYEEFKQRTYFQVLNTIGDNQDTEDIVQEIFITAFEKINNLRSPEAFPAWLNKITVNKCVNHIKRIQKKRNENENLNESVNIELFEEINPDCIPDKAFVNNEITQIIYEIIQKLPIEQRACIHFYYYERLTIAEIAKELAANENTVKTRLALARDKIRAELEQRGDKDDLKLYLGIPLLLIPVLQTVMKNTEVPQALMNRILCSLQISTAAATTATATTEAPAATNVSVVTATTAAAKTVIGIKSIITAAVAVLGITAILLTVFKPWKSVPVNNDAEITTRAKVTEAAETVTINETITTIEAITTFKTAPPSVGTLEIDLTGLDITDDMLAQMVESGEIPQNVTWLSLWENQITDISPLRRLTNLTYLDLDTNQITDVSPISGLINLTKLCLGNNQITDISPLNRLTNLTELQLNNNQIRNISDLDKLTNLTKLYLFDNYISDISPLAELTNLTNIAMYNNEISGLTPLAGLTKLEILYSPNNQITDISPLSKLTNLKKLSLSGNRITDISPLSKLTNLTELLLTNNQITDISPLSELTDLTKLCIGENYSLTDISTLIKLTNLIYLEIWHNDNINDTSVLNKLTNLTVLYLESYSSIITDTVTTLNGLPGLEILYWRIEIGSEDLLKVSKLTNLPELHLYSVVDFNKKSRDNLQNAMPNCDVYLNDIH